jgi:hypothetical protein
MIKVFSFELVWKWDNNNNIIKIGITSRNIPIISELVKKLGKAIDGPIMNPIINIEISSNKKLKSLRVNSNFPSLNGPL